MNTTIDITKIIRYIALLQIEFYKTGAMAPDVGKLKVGKLPKELLEKTEEEAKKKAKAQVCTECCSLILPHVIDIERVTAYCHVI